MRNIKITILTLVATFAVANSSQAQFGKLKSLKNKKISIPKKKKSSTSNSGSSSSPFASVKPRKRSDDGLPAYDRDLKDNKDWEAAKYCKENIKTITNDLNGDRWPSVYINRPTVKRLDRMKENLAYLEGLDAEKNQDYLKNFKEQYQTLSDKRAKEFKTFEATEVVTKEINEWDNTLFDYSDARRAMYNFPDSTLTYAKYSEYRLTVKERFPDNFESEGIVKELKKMDDYFSITVKEHIANMEKEADAIVVDMNKNYGGGDYKEFEYNPKRFIKKFNELNTYVNYYNRKLVTDASQTSSVESKIKTEVDKLNTYVSSGKFDTFMAARNQEKINARLLRKKEMSNASYEGLVKKSVTDATVLKVNIISPKWNVEKNAIDIPKNKWLGVDLAIKKEGKCYLRYGRVKKTYEGGGKYGKTFFAFEDYFNFKDNEMNCVNINKTKK